MVQQILRFSVGVLRRFNPATTTESGEGVVSGSANCEARGASVCGASACGASARGASACGASVCGASARRVLATFVLLLATLVPSLAQSLSVPTIIGDRMVLQRNSTSRFWGYANPNAQVVVAPSWGDEVAVVADGFGQWLAEVPTGEAAERQKVTISSDGEELSFSDIMIGEVWVCSGQSNMQFTVERTIDVVKALKKPNPKVRLYHTGRNSSRVEMDDIYGASWTTSAAAHLEQFSAVGYVFGDMLQRELGVPVGLINASYGGTSIESWMPENEIVENQMFLAGLNESLTKNAHKWKGKERYFAAAQYNANIHPIVNATIAGVIWYQGCHNVTTTVKHYNKLLERFIVSWRERFRNPEMPVYVVQIAPHTYEGIQGALLREKQAEVAAKMEHVEIIATIDQNERTGDIHPRNKQVVGERLAAAALGEHYGLEVDFRAPSYKSMTSEGNKLRLAFNDAEKGFVCEEGRIKGFQVSDMTGRYYLAEAEIDGSEVVVWSESVADPANVRYCFNEYEGNLRCANGLPLLPFRTDFDNSQVGARSFYDTLSEVGVTVKYDDCVRLDFKGREIYLWQNNEIVARDIMPELQGWEFLQPSMLSAGELTPKLTITPDADGYVYVLARNIFPLVELGWEIIPCTDMHLFDLAKKNRPRGRVFLCRHKAKKGKSVVVPVGEDINCLQPIAKSIKYKK